MTRDELTKSITEAINDAIPENKELDGDDIDSIEPVVEKVVEDACEAIDSAEDDEDTEA
jgi:hypothetical protein